VGLAGATALGAYHRSLDLDFRPVPTFGAWLTTLLASHGDLPLALWGVGALASVAVAVGVAYPGASSGPRALVERTGGTVFCGFLLAGAVVVLAASQLPPPGRQDDAAVFALLAAGLLLIGVSSVGVVARRRELRLTLEVDGAPAHYPTVEPVPDAGDPPYDPALARRDRCVGFA